MLKEIRMKRRWYLYLFAVFIFASCSNSGTGELVGTRPNAKPFYQPHPYGMVFIPQGSFTMGAGSEDITHGHLIQPKTVSVGAFYMDQTIKRRLLMMNTGSLLTGCVILLPGPFSAMSALMITSLKKIPRPEKPTIRPNLTGKQKSTGIVRIKMFAML